MFIGRHIDGSVHIECHLLAVRRPGLVAKAVDVLPIPLGDKRELVGGNRVLAVNLVTGGILNLYSIHELACMSTAAVYLAFFHLCPFWTACLSVCLAGCLSVHLATKVSTHPEINVEISASAKLGVSRLEDHAHLIVDMEVLEETLPRMRLEWNVVCCCGPYVEQGGHCKRGKGELHGGAGRSNKGQLRGRHGEMQPVRRRNLCYAAVESRVGDVFFYCCLSSSSSFFACPEAHGPHPQTWASETVRGSKGE